MQIRYSLGIDPKDVPIELRELLPLFAIILFFIGYEIWIFLKKQHQIKKVAKDVSKLNLPEKMTFKFSKSMTEVLGEGRAVLVGEYTYEHAGHTLFIQDSMRCNGTKVHEFSGSITISLKDFMFKGQGITGPEFSIWFPSNFSINQTKKLWRYYQDFTHKRYE